MSANRPGGELAKRPLQFIWICDCSGSMMGKKIQSLNFAIREAIPAMQQVADENPTVDVQVRVVTFSSGAQWHIPQPTCVTDFVWADLSASGVTDMGEAIDLVCEALDINSMPQRGLPPVLVLISDGQPTDNFDGALTRLTALPWGTKSVRIGIAIGDDADTDVLQRFMGQDSREFKPLVATNAPQLVNYIKWASTVPLKAASAPASRTRGDAADGHVGPMAEPEPIPPDSIDPGDVF